MPASAITGRQREFSERAPQAKFRRHKEKEGNRWRRLPSGVERQFEWENFVAIPAPQQAYFCRVAVSVTRLSAARGGLNQPAGVFEAGEIFENCTNQPFALHLKTSVSKIKSRTSLLTRFCPPTCLTLETQAQYKRNPARCQFTTVLGVTRTRDFLHPDQNILNATQNSLCRADNRRRGRCAVARAEPAIVDEEMKSQVFEDEVLARAERADHPPEEMPERQDHSKNIIGKVRINHGAKSFILWVYGVLATYRLDQLSDVFVYGENARARLETPPMHAPSGPRSNLHSASAASPHPEGATEEQSHLRACRFVR
jgi:hypothetical protein